MGFNHAQLDIRKSWSIVLTGSIGESQHQCGCDLVVMIPGKNVRVNGSVLGSLCSLFNVGVGLLVVATLTHLDVGFVLPTILAAPPK